MKNYILETAKFINTAERRIEKLQDKFTNIKNNCAVRSPVDLYEQGYLLGEAN